MKYTLPVFILFFLNIGVLPIAAQSAQDATISGKITDPDQQAIPNQLILLFNESVQFIDSTRTNADGQYQFSGLITDQSYTLAPDTSTGPLGTISTLDVIIGFKALLDKENLLTPYKILAADFDGSGHFSVRDLLMLRRQILGQDQPPSFLNWRFFLSGASTNLPQEITDRWQPNLPLSITLTPGANTANLVVYLVGDLR